jgi:hypothetical protein
MSSQQFIHIVSFDVPFPPNYGGVAAVLFKIKALHKEGYKVVLHTYEYGRGEAKELLAFCEAVHYYKRDTGFKSFSFSTPYIVASRRSKELVARLNADNNPIIFEGVHTTGILPLIKKENRRIAIRLHNIETGYYATLGKLEKSLLKKWYYKFESKLLSKYEHQLFKQKEYVFYPINAAECQQLQSKYPNTTFVFLPPFNDWENSTYMDKEGVYCLYHGNLSVAENIATVEALLEKIVRHSKFNFVIAGKNPSQELQNKVHSYNNVCIIANPDWYEMDELVQKAQICLLPAAGAHGIKLKLIHSLYLGRHCITTPNVVEGTYLDEVCHVAKNYEEANVLIDKLMKTNYTEDNWYKRRSVLQNHYSNANNVAKLVRDLQLHPHYPPHDHPQF